MSKYKAHTLAFFCGLVGLVAYACVDIFVKKVERDYAVVATLIERIRVVEGAEMVYSNMERAQISNEYKKFTQREAKGIREITEDLFSRKLQLVRKCSRLQLIGSIFLIGGGVGIILGTVMMLRSLKRKRVSENKTPMCTCKAHEDHVAPARVVITEVIIAAPLKISPSPVVKKTNVAIIDKNETSRNLAGVMLKKLGYATQVINNKIEFQKCVEIKSIDAVLVSWESRDILGKLEDGEIRVIYTTNGEHIKGPLHVLAKPFTSYDIKRELTTI